MEAEGGGETAQIKMEARQTADLDDSSDQVKTASVVDRYIYT